MKFDGKETVMDHLVEAVPTARADDTVEAVLRHLRSNHWDTLNYVYILDDNHCLIGVVSVRDILVAKNEDRLSNLMTTNLIIAHPHNDQERASILAIQHDIKAVPIVRPGTNEFLGVVGAGQILKILHEEHTEDFLRLSGVQRGHPVIDIYHTSIGRLARLRLPWLFVGLGGGILATIISESFEITLRQQITVAFFIPIIVYMSDAVGTQTETIYVRGLALRQTSLVRQAWRELSIGLVIATIMSTLTYLFAGWWLGAGSVAFAVALAMFINITLAPLVALVVPTLLYWLKRDPALGAGPFTTVIQDLISLLIYFLVATWLLL